MENLIPSSSCRIKKSTTTHKQLISSKKLAQKIREARRNLFNSEETNPIINNNHLIKIHGKIPDEVFREFIFPCLDIRNLTLKCSLVCKRWFSNVMHSRISVNDLELGTLSSERQQRLTCIVKSFKCIEKITMRNDGREDYSLIRYISENGTELKELNITGNLYNQGHIVTRYLSNGVLNSLEVLSLTDYEMEERGILHLTKQESCLKKLTSLGISDSKLGNNLVHLSSLTNLKSLSLEKCKCDEKAMETLCLGLKQLERLTVKTVNRNYFKHIANLSNLKYLQITVMNIDIATYLSNGTITNLQHLSIGIETIDNRVLETLFSGNLNQIAILELKYCNLNSFEAIANLKSLKELHVSGQSPTSAFQELSEGICKLEKLVWRDAPFSQILNSPVKYFNSPTFDSLKFLDLSYCHELGGKLHLLLEGKLSHLQYLDVNSSNINDEDLKFLKEEIIKTLNQDEEPLLSHLTYLNLSRNYIRDEGCRYLSECDGLFNLKRLTIERNNIGEEGSNFLVMFALARPSLTILDEEYSINP